jgi:DNA repair protein RecN (Recombination protein N)
MLLELVIENYAVIERIRVRFRPGLNLLTGETGSGKSIVVDALALLFGERASQDAVRTGAPRARISGLFEVPRDRRFQELLEQAGIETEDGELLLEREISAEGKSRAFAGSRPATAALLRSLAPWLGDIHGQHEQQLLFSAEAQLDMLDAFAAAGELRERTAALFRRWRGVTAEIEELEHTEQEKLRMLDLWEFQRKEIEAVGPAPGEDAALEQERRVLQNCARLQEAAHTAYAALYDSPDAVLSQMRAALRRLEELCRIDPRLDPVRESLQPALVAVEEASYAVRDYLSGLEADPARLEEIEMRLAALDRLKRKYGSTAEEILAFLAHVRERIGAVENAGERKAGLRREQEALAADYQHATRELSDLRRQSARRLERRVENELGSLAMDGAVFRIGFEPAPWSESGTDAVGFLVSANAGEEPRPIEKAASGGEISRIALAIKTSIAATTAPKRGFARTLVFDEVDAGIGGRAAETVGRRLKQLAAANQVLCVTHLPQIAGFADHHFRVEKQEADGRTAAKVEELEAGERTREIGRMLSGERLTREALRQAEQLIRAAMAGPEA